MDPNSFVESKFDLVVLYDKFGKQITQMPLCEILDGDIKNILVDEVQLSSKGTMLSYTRLAFVQLIRSQFDYLQFDSVEIVFKENHQSKIKI